MRVLRGPTPRVVPLAVLAALLAACGGGERAAEKEEGRGREKGAERPERGGTAVIAELHDLQKPMPIVWQSELDGELVDVLYMGLTRGAWRDGRLVQLTSGESPMALAWHWEYASPDSSVLRYRMKSGLRWSDGRPITAADVVWTYRMIADSQTASPRLHDVETIDSVVAENDSTVRFHFRRRHPDMLFAASLPVAPRHGFEGTAPAGIRTHPSFSRPERLVVSGPFRISAWTPGQQVVLTPSEHFSVRPLLDRIVIRIVPEPTTRLVELRTGNADMVRNITFDQVPMLRQRAPNLRFAKVEDRYWEYVAYNPRRGAPFDDPELRRALGMAIDVPGIVRALRMEEFATPAAGPYPPLFRDLYDPRATPPLAHDPDSARKVLEAKGWRDADGDSIREKGGKRLRFTLLTNAGNQRRADVSQILQRQWRSVGADVQLRQLEFNAFQERQMAKDFDALLGSWGVNLSPDLSVAFATGAPFNIVSFASPEVDRLFREAKAAPTPATANPLWREAAAKIVQGQPYTWLYHYDVVVGLGERLRGVRVDTFGAYQNTWEWWVRGGGGAASAAGPAAANDSAGE